MATGAVTLKTQQVRTDTTETMYAMRRANGDWFEFTDQGRLRVPVFRSSWAAMLARTRNMGMLLFKPSVLGTTTLDALASSSTSNVCFWLVDDPSVKLSRGRPLEYKQLALLISDDSKRAEEI